jgi:hypothetical protein
MVEPGNPGSTVFHPIPLPGTMKIPSSVASNSQYENKWKLGLCIIGNLCYVVKQDV